MQHTYNYNNLMHMHANRLFPRPQSVAWFQYFSDFKEDMGFYLV